MDISDIVYSGLIRYNKGTNKREGNNTMYETVKIINGHAIYRMVGTRGFFHVRLTANCEVTFRTIKAAAAYIVTNL